MIVFPRRLSQDIETIDVSSEVFADHGLVPIKYTCDGFNISPPLSLKNIPLETESMVVIMEDLNAPIRSWTHWLMWNIPPTSKIKENFASPMSIIGKNDFGKKKYIGPTSTSVLHRYIFKVYALDGLLPLKNYSTKLDVEREMSAHILGFGQLVGLYKSVKNN